MGYPAVPDGSVNLIFDVVKFDIFFLGGNILCLVYLIGGLAIILYASQGQSTTTHFANIIITVHKLPLQNRHFGTFFLDDIFPSSL